MFQWKRDTSYRMPDSADQLIKHYVATDLIIIGTLWHPRSINQFD